jgi:hypothetical protein
VAHSKPPEGWALMDSLVPKWHYFKDNLSACQRWMLQNGTKVEQGDEREPICGHCIRILNKWREKG